ncbi:FecCD family ABC transporter permease [Teredinibacter purpureus]|uniref:FecCD family ABC transporter permease n=1 Tax=Teredinibacter purpureus TaxID=2731756 RepID=UPI0005F82E65|nr:iron ABC transporter permease [Teredinibacter purpureus]
MLLKPDQLRRLWPTIIGTSVVLVLLGTAVSCLFGAVSLSSEQLWQWLHGNGDIYTTTIIEKLRLPRALLAGSIGAILAVSGTVTQGLFRNPLADPSLIGVSAGAAAGASIVIVLLNQNQWNLSGLSLVSLGAFAGSIIVVSLVYRISTDALGTSVSTMLLAGIAFTFLAGSLTSLLEYFADNEMLRQITLWRMGGLEMADGQKVALVGSVGIVIFIVLNRQATALNALLLGESEARHLGISVNRVKKIIILCVAAGVGISVAIAGTIAFVGLVVPHIVRMSLGPNHTTMIPMTACIGALTLLIADVIARTAIAPAELPVGLVTAFIGAPVFIAMLIQRKQRGWR